MRLYRDIKKAAKRSLLRTLQPCQEVAPLMSESLERKLTLPEFLKLRLHLLVCAWCARYLKQIRFLRWMMRQQTSPASYPTVVALNAEARDRITRSLVKTHRDCH